MARRTAAGFLVVLVVVGLMFLACGGAAFATGGGDCVAADKLDQEIVPEAELAGFTCSFKPYEGAECLHVTVGVKNVSTAPQRYRINVFFDNGKAVGGLLPQKTKNGLVEPGQTASFTYPVTGMTAKPGSIFLRIGTMGK